MFKGKKDPAHTMFNHHQMSNHQTTLNRQIMSRSPRFTLLSLILRTAKPGELVTGFTLLELLVAMIVGSILTLALLFSAVQLMGTNQREGARSDTQREVQAAIDYIARDLREAIYVYDGQCLNPAGSKPVSTNDPTQGLCGGLLNSLPPQLNTTTNLPVLAFWRVDPIPAPLAAACRSPANITLLTRQKTGTNDQQPIDEVNCGAKRMFTLVVYSLNRQNSTVSGKSLWGGRARITRYQLPKYTYDNSTTATITTGWVAPDGTESSFLSWPIAGENGIRRQGLVLAAKGVPPRANYWDNKVLVDFIDDPSQSAVVKPAEPPATCANPPIVAGGSAPAIITPDQAGAYAATTIPKNIFYACVRGSGGANLNQEVLVRIRANGAGRAGLNLRTTELPLTMETRVLTRGLTGKDS